MLGLTGQSVQQGTGSNWKQTGCSCGLEAFQLCLAQEYLVDGLDAQPEPGRERAAQKHPPGKGVKCKDQVTPKLKEN